ncbi:MAG TPA: glycerophosphodiester phosphodiesterase family protein [Gryllotalpicola sp.]
MSARPLAIGHRGAPLLARENTLESIGAAIRHGADWVEVDAKLTADGRLVLLHDATLERLWEVELAVADATFEEIRTAVSAVPTRSARPASGIPTLDAAIEIVSRHDAVLLVDIASPEIATACAHSAEVAAKLDRLAFTGDPDALAVIRAALPGAVILMSWEERGLPSGAVFARVRPDYFNQLAALADRTLAEEVHGRGLLLSVYTVDEPAEMTRLLDAGADAIISNDIVALTRMRTRWEATT